MILREPIRCWHRRTQSEHQRVDVLVGDPGNDTRPDQEWGPATKDRTPTTYQVETFLPV